MIWESNLKVDQAKTSRPAFDALLVRAGHATL
jgi:hypothetical protein